MLPEGFQASSGDALSGNGDTDLTGGTNYFGDMNVSQPWWTKSADDSQLWLLAGGVALAALVLWKLKK